jgi:isopentenyl-diphosphate delta-isomerase
MNFAQEIVQPEGDTNAKGCMAKLYEFASELPILAKETGTGISSKMAKALKKTGVRGIDVGGLGGTSFPAVEMYRGQSSNDPVRTRMGQTFWDWGIPTPVSLIESSVGLPLIATGGIRSGLDIAKALSLGASAAGIAGHLLKPALKSAKSVKTELELIIEELKSALFLLGVGNVIELVGKKVYYTGRTHDILVSLGYLKK